MSVNCNQEKCIPKKKVQSSKYCLSKVCENIRVADVLSLCDPVVHGHLACC